MPLNKKQFSRRTFLARTLQTTAGISLTSGLLLSAESFGEVCGRQKSTAAVRGAFIYPPTESLKEVGYYSWPGSSFGAEARQAEYTGRLKQIERNLGMQISMNKKPLDDDASVTQFINEVKKSKPDGLLLIPLKKSHWRHVIRIVEEVKIPTVAFVTLGILLSNHIEQLHRKPGVYLINSLDNLDAVEYGMKMIKTARWMKDARLVDIAPSQSEDSIVPHLGTQIRTIPHVKFFEEFERTKLTNAVKRLAKSYAKNAKKIVQPSKAEITEAAKTYFVLKKILKNEKADALMMKCLQGLSKPHKHPPPCMGFMTLRDEGIVAGCQSDLSATLTLMLVQQLFDKPGFQQNASMETEKNLYFGAHCTSPSKMNGPGTKPEPYILMNHAEAGWGCVPRVLFTKNQEVTMAQYLPKQIPGMTKVNFSKYLPKETPEMLIYSGKIVDCPPIPQTGGCRTNIEMTINEVDDVCDVKGMHQIIFYGNYAKQLRNFCQLYGIKAVS